MLKIYGSPASSAGRCFWFLEELGLPYERIALDMRKGEHKMPAYLAINPNGKVPTLVDGDVVIWESAAINFYLARRYGPKWLGEDPIVSGKIYQWTIWAIAEFQKPLIDLFIQTVFVPEAKRDQAVCDRARIALAPMLKVLNQALEGRTYLAGDEFTLADLNVHSVVWVAMTLKEDLSHTPNLLDWYHRICERPAWLAFGKLADEYWKSRSSGH